jgi:hypothetical protein
MDMDLMDHMDHQLKGKKKVTMDHQKLFVQNVEKNLNSQKDMNNKKEKFIEF